MNPVQTLITLLFFVAGCAGSLLAQPELAWARAIPGPDGTEHTIPYLSTDGTVIVVGQFYTTTDFDPGPGQVLLTSAGNSDVFMAKYDTLGALLWAKRIGGGDYDIPAAVRTDATGNIYLCGSFASGGMDFDPGAGVHTLSSSGGNDIFMAKYDPDGNYTWAVKMGGVNGEGGADMELDQAGNIYLAGRFTGPTDFDPSAATFTLTAAGSTDIYFCKLTNAGGFVWAKRIGATGQDMTNKLAVTSDGTVYICGVITGTVDADPGAGVYNVSAGSSNDIFLGKYDTDGNFAWAHATGSSGIDNGMHVEIAADGNILAMGTFSQTVDFDFGTGTANHTSSGITDVFVAKYTPAGAFLWMKQMGNSTYDWIQSTSVDAYGHIYYCGYFSNTLDTDPGPGVHNLVADGTDDGYVVKLDPDGNFVWSRGITGPVYQYGYEIHARGTDDVYFGGIFLGTTDFDPPNSYLLTSSGNTYDGYFARVRNCIDSVDVSVTACDQYTWNGVPLTASGTYTRRLYTTVGCDSVVTLHLTVHPSSVTDTTATVCGSFAWHGTLYTTSGTYNDTLTGSGGCDSIVRLHLTSYPVHSSLATIGACNSYTWHGTALTTSGLYTDTLTGVHGCDSIARLNLTIYQPATVAVYDTVCGSTTWNGTTYTASGNYAHSFLTVHGCDSTVTLHLLVRQPSASTLSATACSSYTWFGNTLTASGTYMHTLTNAAGCDSTITLALTIHQPTSSVQNVSACTSYAWHGNTYTVSGTYHDTLVNAAGCDSIAHLILTIYLPATVTVYDTVCGSTTWNGTTYTTSGSYSQSLQTIHGCDSTVTLHLLVRQPSASTLSATACSNYTWFGNTLTASGTYTHTLTNAVGCDSTITLSLTIHQPTASVQTVSACTSYTWHGNTYTASGTYSDTLVNAAGCDSIAHLILTIYQPATVVVYDTVCGSTTWNGTTYSASGTYPHSFQTIHGCDSTVTLHLLVRQPSASALSATACGNYTWFGTTLTASGTYTHTLPNAAGCDSTITLSLTVLAPVTATISAASCGPYSWNGSVYATSGTYMQSFQAVNGCDSTVTLNLVVHTINASVTLSGATLTATQPGAAYQWLSCSPYSTLAGETQQAFTALQNGNYAVIVTEAGCSDTSACTTITDVGLPTYAAGSILLSPNPTGGSVTIVSPTEWQSATLRLFDATGQELLVQEGITGQQVTLDLGGYTTEVYYVQIEEGMTVYRGKVVRE